jgi:hypothetical protein
VTGDATRDLPGAALESVRRYLASVPDAEPLAALLEGDAPRDMDALGKVFGEELPSGLVLDR